LENAGSALAAGDTPSAAAGEAAAASETVRVDHARIESLRLMEDADNPDLVDGLIDLFVSDSPTHIANLHRAVAEGNARLLEQTAHRFQSSLDNLGAARMSAICVRLERLGIAQRVGDAAALLTALDEEYRTVVPELLGKKGGGRS
jgi:two-component system, sensor histidine kinase and response regulator